MPLPIETEMERKSKTANQVDILCCEPRLYSTLESCGSIVVSCETPRKHCGETNPKPTLCFAQRFAQKTRSELTQTHLET